MSKTPRREQELYGMLDRLCNELLPDDEAAQLGDILESDLEAQELYVRYFDLQAALREQALSFDDETFAIQEAISALDEQHEVEASELSAGGVETPQTLAFKNNAVRALDSSPAWRRWAVRLTTASVAAAAVVAGIALFIRDQARDEAKPAAALAVVSTPEIHPARLSGSVAARWAGARIELPEGEFFDAGQRLELIEGLAEVQFHDARIVLQGPAILVIDGDNSAVLTLGRIAASTKSDVPFTLRTTAGIFRSQTAEFGIEVETDGSLLTKVFAGDLKIHSSGWAGSSDFELHSDQGVRIDDKRITRLERSFDLSFVRYLPSRQVALNLADVVAGGDGFGKANQRGISLVDGSAASDYGIPTQGDGTYHRAQDFEFIDGVFIPNGAQGPVQVDSIGRRFADFPTTYGDCWSGAIMTRRPRDEESLPFIKLEFHGDNYGYINWLNIASNPDELSPEGHGLIGMHSNCGITFDLHAIRTSNPGMKLFRFRAKVGNLESRPDRHAVDAWLLVDGQLRYRRQGFSREDGAETIEVPLSDRDRFLVLAITDAGGHTAYDWAAFGDCLIEMRSLDGLSADVELPQRLDSQPALDDRSEAAPTPKINGHSTPIGRVFASGDAVSSVALSDVAGRFFQRVADLAESQRQVHRAGRQLARSRTESIARAF